MPRTNSLFPTSRGEVIGVVDPRLIYDTDAVRQYAGIGEVKLLEARRAGLIEARRYNGRYWYRGEDLIALITGEAEQKQIDERLQTAQREMHQTQARKAYSRRGILLKDIQRKLAPKLEKSGRK